MPTDMAATAGDAWRPRRVAFVQTPAADRGCRCQVRLVHNNDQASVSLQLQHATGLTGVNNNPPRQVLLHIQPSIIESCSIAQETSISPLLLKCIPTSIAGPSDVLTVTLALKSPGAVHYPKELTSVCPTDPADVDFQSFVEICQATTLYIHFAKAQFDHLEKPRLERLVKGLSNGDLKAPPLNLAREDRGRGLQEGTWQVFGQQDPESNHSKTPSGLGKRPRQGKNSEPSISPSLCSHDTHPSVSSFDTPLKRPAPYAYTTPPPYSPTEVDTTPTTRSGHSNDIRPTIFTLPPYRKGSVSPPENGQVALLANMLATVPEHVLREAIVKSGHGRLLGLVSVGAVLEKPFEPRARRLSSPRLTSLVKDLFTAEVEARMKYLVESGLPLHTKDAIEKVMDEYHNVFHVDCQEAEAAIQEKVEDASLDVKMALEDGMKEIEELVEAHLHKLADEHEIFDGKANLELDNLRCWFVKFARTLIFEKQLENSSGRDLVRCTSI
ncbi:hypothetical protein E4T48_04374 [Aureobasidium sp. EXF-10727]|nr:hypothetical protein E4T48_04374 [Aureobasidium sp. EXF-10727]